MVKIIELFGLPSTGKTTTALKLVDYFNNINISSEYVKDRASSCPIQNKKNPLFNVWISSKLLASIVEAEDRMVEYIIADRGFIDCLIWSHTFSDNVKKNELVELISNILYSSYINNKEYYAFFFHANYKDVLNRRIMENHLPHEGSIVNPTIAKEYIINYNNIYNTINIKVHNIDSSTLTLDEIFCKILNVLLTCPLSSSPNFS